MATLHAYSSDPRALLVLADFASTAPTTAAVRLPSTGAPHRSKGAFHTHQWAFSHQAVGRVDVDHVQLVIRSSHRRLLRSCPGAVLRFLRVVPRSETRVRGRSAAPTRAPEPQHARVGLRVETDPCSAPQSASPAPTLELAHRHGADDHSGTYLWRLEGLTAVWHAGGREGTVRCIQGRLWGSQHSGTYLWRLRPAQAPSAGTRRRCAATPRRARLDRPRCGGWARAETRQAWRRPDDLGRPRGYRALGGHGATGARDLLRRAARGCMGRALGPVWPSWCARGGPARLPAAAAARRPRGSPPCPF